MRLAGSLNRDSVNIFFKRLLLWQRKAYLKYVNWFHIHNCAKNKMFQNVNIFTAYGILLIFLKSERVLEAEYKPSGHFCADLYLYYGGQKVAI